MTVTRIGSDFTVPIPDQFRKDFPAGQEVAVTTDEQGRLVVTPIEQVRSLLLETFGMWSNRLDLPDDGTAYMDEIRRGQRLDDFSVDDEGH